MSSPTFVEFIQIFGFSCSIAVIPIAVVGVFVNWLNIFIFSRPQLKRSDSMNILLVGLSVSHCAYILSDAPLFVMVSFYSQENGFLHTYLTSMMVYVYPLVMMAQTASIWCLVMVVAERRAAICKSNKAYSRKKSVIVLSMIGVFSIAYNFCRFWENGNDEHDVFSSGMRNNDVYNMYYMRWFYFVLMFLIPFTVIITYSFSIIFTLCTKASWSHTRSPSIVNRTFNERDMIERKNALMIAVVGFVFIVFNSLSFVVIAIETTKAKECTPSEIFRNRSQSLESNNEKFSTFEKLDLNGIEDVYQEQFGNILSDDDQTNGIENCFPFTMTFWISVYISTVLAHINSCINFFIYLCFNKNFRLVCFKVFVIITKCFVVSEPPTDMSDGDEDEGEHNLIVANGNILLPIYRYEINF